MEAPEASLAENPVTAGAVPSDAEPLMVVLERASDGTWVATPDYGGKDDEQAPPPHGGHHHQLVGNADASSTSRRARKVRLARWALACTIIDFKFDVKELIDEYFTIGIDPHVKRQRALAMFRGEDERSLNMLTLPYDGLLEVEGGGDEPVDEAAAQLLLLQAAESSSEGKDDGGDAGEEGEGPLRFVKKELSAAGFVDARHMRMSIEAFFDGNIDVDDEDADDEVLTCFRASFMFATGFVNRLWDVRRILEVYMDEDDGLDLEARRATMARMLGELEEVLDARAMAVATGRIKLIE